MSTESNNAAGMQQRENKALLFGMGVIVLACIIFAICGFWLLKKPADIVQGQAEATSVRISGKLPGRVSEIYVKEGDMVKAGDTLVHIHSSLAEARLMQAESMEDVARSQNKLADAGARKQVIDAAADMVRQAEAGVGITKKTYDRMERLYKEGVMSEQKRDEAKAAYDAAVAALGAAKSQLSLAKAGARSEEKEGAAAMVNVAKGGVSEVNAVLEDQYLIAPYDGQIDAIYPQESELVMMGAPIMSLMKIDDKYVTFNVREDLLSQMPLGGEIEIMIPALDKKTVKARIYYSRDMGSYATWQSTKSVGEWDSKTFEIKARPEEAIPELRPGMTVIYYKK